MISPSTLERLEELLAKIPSGEWKASGHHIDLGGGGMIYDEGGHSDDEASLIAEMRNALPDLIATARELTALRAVYEEVQREIINEAAYLEESGHTVLADDLRVVADRLSPRKEQA